MGLLLKQIFAFIKLLNSETGTHQIASGIACGFILGMSPTLSMQTLLVFAIIFVFRVQVGAAFLSAFFFKFLAYLFDPAFDAIGSWILELESLQSIFTTLYNLPLIPLTRFNNSIVMGAGVLAILLFPFVFYFSIFMISKYRDLVVAKIKSTRFWKAVQATSLYKWYYKYDELFG